MEAFLLFIWLERILSWMRMINEGGLSLFKLPKRVLSWIRMINKGRGFHFELFKGVSSQVTLISDGRLLSSNWQKLARPGQYQLMKVIFFFQIG